MFARAGSLGLPVKLHADQLSNLGGAALAARHNALSADHLEHTDEAGAAAMAANGTVAVLLPGAYYFIRETKLPPLALFRQHKVAMAIATDCNPGTSPLTSLLLTMNMAATLFRMTVEECLLGVTRDAARALHAHSSRSAQPFVRVATRLLDAASATVAMVGAAEEGTADRLGLLDRAGAAHRPVH